MTTEATESHTTSRRALLGAVAIAPALALPVAPGATQGVAAVPNAPWVPDVHEQRMIALCGVYIDALRRFNDESTEDSDTCPFWAEAEQARDELDDWEPSTMPGIIAAAGIAEWMAEKESGGPYDEWSEAFTGHWPVTVTKALLRLYCPASAEWALAAKGVGP